MMLGKKKIAEKEAAMYDTAMKDYEKRMVKYEEKMKRYEEATVKYKVSLKAYRKDLKQWTADMKAQEMALKKEKEAELKKQQKVHYEQEMALYEKRLATWERVRKERIEAFENDYEATGNTNFRSVQNYFYRVNTLGWINCDRFLDIPEEERLALAINDPDDSEEKVFVVFKDINSMLRVRKQEQQYLTNAIPASSMVTIIGLKVEDGKALMAMQEVRADSQTAFDLDFQPTSLRNIRKQLEQLN